MSLLVFYLLTSWMPTLLNSAGQSMQSAQFISLMLPVGSTVGAIAIGLLMDRFNPHVVLFGSYTLAAAFIILALLCRRFDGDRYALGYRCRQ